MFVAACCFRVGHFGGRDSTNIMTVLKNKVETFEEKGIHLNIIESPFTIAMLTPIMKRSHQSTFSSEIVFVDSSGSCDQGGSSVTFLFGACKVGAVPLGCIIHQGQTENAYLAAFEALKVLLGNSGFGGTGCPAVFMTDDSLAERNALAAAFPASTLLLCIFHVCQALWRWLWDGKNAILLADRQFLMRLFRAVLFAKFVVECEEAWKGLEEDDVALKYPRFLAHLSTMWDRRKEWCLCFRGDLLTRGHNTNNFVEASIRVFKDIVLERCKAFNAAALVDFVGTVLEQYHQKRLLKYASARVTKPELQYRRFCHMAKNTKLQQMAPNVYHVTSSVDEDVVYQVHSDIEQCDCPFGQGGAFCKHLCAVHIQDGLHFKTLPSLSFEDRVNLAKLAMGTVDESFFLGITQDASVETDTPADFQMSMTYHDPAQNVTDSEMDMCSDDPNSMIGGNGSNTVGVRLMANFHRIASIADANPSAFMQKMITSLNQTLEKIETPQGIFDLCTSLAARRHSRVIRVQPTSVSRRKKRPGLTCGSKRIQAGRPANAESGKLSARKRKRCLSININSNKPNAKPHGSGH